MTKDGAPLIRISAGESLIGSKKSLNHEEQFGVIYLDTGRIARKGVVYRGI